MQDLVQQLDWFSIGEQLKLQIFGNTFTTKLAEIEKVLYALDPELVTSFQVFCGEELHPQVLSISSRWPNAVDTLDAWEHHKTPKIENLDAIETLIKKTQSVVAKFLCMRAIIDIAADDNNALLIYQTFQKIMVLPNMQEFPAYVHFMQQFTSFAFVSSLLCQEADINIFQNLDFDTRLKNQLFGEEQCSLIKVQYRDYNLEASKDVVQNQKSQLQILKFLINISVQQRNNLSYQVVMDELQVSESELEKAFGHLILSQQIKARLDQIGKKIFVEYVRPIALDDVGKQVLRDRIDDIIGRVDLLQDVLTKVLSIDNLEE